MPDPLHHRHPRLLLLQGFVYLLFGVPLLLHLVLRLIGRIHSAKAMVFGGGTIYLNRPLIYVQASLQLILLK